MYMESGKNVMVYNDHNPQKSMDSMKGKNARLARWSLILQGQETEIRHIRGRDNVAVDTVHHPE